MDEQFKPNTGEEDTPGFTVPQCETTRKTQVNCKKKEMEEKQCMAVQLQVPVRALRVTVVLLYGLIISQGGPLVSLSDFPPVRHLVMSFETLI